MKNYGAEHERIWVGLEEADTAYSRLLAPGSRLCGCCGWKDEIIEEPSAES
jgi:hypothetical protein